MKSGAQSLAAVELKCQAIGFATGTDLGFEFDIVEVDHQAFTLGYWFHRFVPFSHFSIA